MVQVSVGQQVDGFIAILFIFGRAAADDGLHRVNKNMAVGKHMQMKKLSDKEALAELAEWCRPFGLVPCVFPNMICVSWLDPDDPDDKWGSVAIHMDRPMLGRYNISVAYSMQKRVSLSTTCQKIINSYFKKQQWISWSRIVQEKTTAYNIMRRDTVEVRIPEANSPAEMELKLAANGWTGNPFGPSRSPS